MFQLTMESSQHRARLKWILLAYYCLFLCENHVSCFRSTVSSNTRFFRLKSKGCAFVGSFSFVRATSQRNIQEEEQQQEQQQRQVQASAQHHSASPPLELEQRDDELISINSLDSNFNASWENVLNPPECSIEQGVNSDHTPCIIPGPPHPKLTLVDQTVFGGFALTLATVICGLIWATGEWRYYLSGGTCAALSHVIPVPVDVVKTRKQVDAKFFGYSFVDATKHIYRNEGWRALFVGSGPTFVGYFLEGAIKFGVYELLKPFVQALFLPMTQFSVNLAKYSAFCVSAAISGLSASIMLCPMEALRIRLVAEQEYASLGWIRGGITMMKREGVSAFTKGLLPMIYKQVPYTVTKNVSFDLFTKLGYYSLLVAPAVAGTATTGLYCKLAKFAIPFASAAIASVLSCISSQPGDMLLSLVNAHKGASRTTHDIARDILRSKNGLSGFFVGMKARFLHVGIIVTLQLFIYDLVKRFCGIAATGSV